MRSDGIASQGRSLLVLLGMLGLCFVSGCYERVTDGQQSIYRFAWWLGPLVIAGGVLGIPLGWFLRAWSKRWGFVVLVLAPVLLLIVAPAMYRDRVLIDDEHFEARYGFWFNPTEHKVLFRSLREIRHVAVRDYRGRVKHEVHCVPYRGQVLVIHAGDLVINTVPEIMARARARGVIVVSDGF